MSFCSSINLHRKSEVEETKGRSMGEERDGVRIYVGGLGESVSRDDLLKIFSSMGSVEAVDFVRSKGRSFAYVDFSPSSHNSLTKLFSTYNGCVWKGGKLRLEKAKEHYLARLRREWNERSDDNTICLPQPPSMASESTHLKIFFPRLRKVKSVPLTGSGKHKYSFQRVEVPSMPKYFCDCEEHSTPHILQGNCCRDEELQYPGINAEELNIMNRVMNRLFQSNSEQETESFLADVKDDNIEEEEKEEEEDDEEDNLVINVVSYKKATLPLSRNWDQETVSRTLKSINNGTQEIAEGYTQGEKRNCVLPSDLKQSMIHEGRGTKKSTPEMPENKEPLEVHPDKSSIRPGTGVNNSSSSVFHSQKSSWKALLASADNSKFCVSNVLSDIVSSKEEQHTSSKSDFVNLPTQEDLDFKEVHVPSMERSTARSIVKKPTRKLKPPRKTGKSVAADTTEKNEYTSVDSNVEAEPVELESSVRDSAIDTSFQDFSNKEIVVGPYCNPTASTLLTSAKDHDEFVPEKSDAEKNVHAETQNPTVKENVDEGKEPLEAFDRSARGSSWRQKSSWTQLVSEKSRSFSITQLFPDLNPKNHEPREINHEDAEKSHSNQRGAAMQSEVKPNKDCLRAVGINEDSHTQNSSDWCQPNQWSDALTTVTAEERDATKKPPIGAKTGTGEACLFMRSAASLKAWADAKRVLTEPRKRKRHGN